LSIRETAICELSEEGGLKGGELIPLYSESSEGIPELKWGRNRFIPYLVIDPEVDETPGAQDAEEMIEVRSDVSIEELKKIILRGELMLTGVQTAVMACEWLKEKGMLDQSKTIL
ncbi:hypothetical protein HK096_009364, partial [Nowakowskiella sp. JEL0078]